MFEKEAEEWADKEFEKYKTLEWYARKNNFQKGAEFGYNKANEWHYVKDKLPPIKELSKENEQLKDRLELLNLNANIAVRDLNDLLTKAKELLSKLLEEEKNNMYWEMNGSDKSSYYEVRKQAEQFLKETEK